MELRLKKYLIHHFFVILLLACSADERISGGSTTEPRIPIQAEDLDQLESYMLSNSALTRVELYNANDKFSPIAQAKIIEGHLTFKGDTTFLKWPLRIAIHEGNEAFLSQELENQMTTSQLEQIQYRALKESKLNVDNSEHEINHVQAAFNSQDFSVKADSVQLLYFPQEDWVKFKTPTDTVIYRAQKSGDELLLHPIDSTQVIPF